jgi:hypothetical protein
VPHRPLPRLQPNSGSPEFGRFINWPKSETSDLGWRDREGARNKTHVCKLTLSPPLPRKRGREQTECAGRLSAKYRGKDSVRGSMCVTTNESAL